MSATNTPDRTQSTTGQAPDVELSLRPNRLFTLVAIFAMVIGFGSVLGGITGAVYTYQQAAVENITTPGDAAIPDTPVRGPLSMWAQSDIITQHQLDTTDGQRYAEMDREDPERMSWITATSLTTVLGMGIMAYALSAFAIVVGLTLAALGLIVFKLRKTTVSLS